MAVSFDRARLGPLRDTVAVVGVGETDYAKDYRGAGGQAMGKGEARYDSYTLASRALRRALDDAGLEKDDIDGLCVGGTLSGERASEQWGLNPRWSGAATPPSASSRRRWRSTRGSARRWRSSTATPSARWTRPTAARA